MSTAELQTAIKSFIVKSVLADVIGQSVQTDAWKYCIPVDVDGVRYYCELALVAKKGDFDVEKANADYRRKKAESEAKAKAKAEERAKAKAKAKKD